MTLCQWRKACRTTPTARNHTVENHHLMTSVCFTVELIGQHSHHSPTLTQTSHNLPNQTTSKGHNNQNCGDNSGPTIIKKARFRKYRNCCSYSTLTAIIQSVLCTSITVVWISHHTGHDFFCSQHDRKNSLVHLVLLNGGLEGSQQTHFTLDKSCPAFFPLAVTAQKNSFTQEQNRFLPHTITLTNSS